MRDIEKVLAEGVPDKFRVQVQSSYVGDRRWKINNPNAQADTKARTSRFCHAYEASATEPMISQ